MTTTPGPLLSPELFGHLLANAGLLIAAAVIVAMAVVGLLLAFAGR